MFRAPGVLRVPSWIAFGCNRNDPRITRCDTKYVSLGNLILALVTVLSVSLVCLSLAGTAQAHPAWGIAVDRQGQVYFSDLKTIWKIDAQGKLSVFRAGGHTHDLNIDSAGNVYGEHDFSTIWKMTPAGDFSYVQAPTGNPPRGVSIWTDRDGNMYSVEQNNHLKRETLLLRRTPGGNVSVLAGSSYGQADGKGSQAKFRNIVGMAFGPDGSLYLTDGSSVRKVTMDGTVSTLAHNVMVENASGNPAGGSSLFGIAVDAQGNVFVADYGNRRVLKIASDNQLTTLLRAEPPWFPTGVACSGNDVFVLEHSFTPAHAPVGTRVRQLSPDGRINVLASVGEIQSPSAGDRSSIESSETLAASNQPRYLVIGAAIGIFALATVIVWSLSRRMYNGRREQK